MVMEAGQQPPATTTYINKSLHRYCNPKSVYQTSLHITIILAIRTTALLLLVRTSEAKVELVVGFYSETCPEAESIVRTTVQNAVSNDPTAAAVLLRLHFHDCFVQGCDGSILIDRNQEDDERNALGHLGVRGFDIIESAKSALERVCPEVVSCADIVALAARDALVLSSGHSSYAVPTGRRDGRVSEKSLADEMPDVDEPIHSLKAKFANKGLTSKQFVLLSAAHTIGTTACFFMPKRLYNFTGEGDSDPSINPNLLGRLKSRCPDGGNPNIRLPLDPVTEFEFDDQILRNVRDGSAVISSDARLYDDRETKEIIDSYLSLLPRDVAQQRFASDFADAMVKMGNLGVKTGTQDGEIRNVCASFN